MRYGTSYFPSRWDAVKYYSVLGFKSSEVKEMIKNGEIHIGMPKTTKNQRPFLMVDHGDAKRWFISQLRAR